jgi:hypothetical protein
MKTKTNKPKKYRHVYLGIPTAEYVEIEKKYKKSTCRSLSEYIRNIIIHNPITIRYRDQSLEDLIEEIVLLNDHMKQVKETGYQVLKKMQGDQEISQCKLLLREFQDTIVHLNKRIEEIKLQIEKIVEKWSQS